MTEPVQLFRLRVDGLVAEENIPVAQLSGLLNDYGVVKDSTLNRLMAGQSERVLGQELELSRQTPEVAPRLYTLLVDGKVAAKDVPDAELEKLLANYGARRKEISRGLVAGKTQRVLGQDLKLLTQAVGHTVHVNAQHEQSTTEAIAEPTAPKAPRAQPESAPPATAPTPFDAPLQELISRAKKLRKGTLIYGGTALGLAIFGGVFYALGIAAEPTTAIDQILVPDAIAMAFQTSGHAGDGIGGLMGVESVVDSILNSTALKMISAVAMIAGVGLAVITGRLFNIVPALMVGMMPHVMGAFMGILDPGTTSKPSEFYSAVESKNLPTLQRLLSSREDLDEVAKAYVLAQASVAEGSSSKWVVLTAKNLREGKIKGNFAVPAGIAYAIEATALGQESQSLSDRAEQHRQSALAEANDWKRNSFWALLLAGLFGVIATGHESIAQIIFRRVRRIGELLTPLR
ncbi:MULTISPECIES: tellurite resistance protein [Pseudomonas]|uniref:tellurite resistance protein n=1 Tax=Pseudomonas TaxID=286 RepID=UPI000A3533B0|nr:MULTISPECIES: tellurite resistance protein [Pseudomonas]MBK3467920.1 hypothetical protein [Pseudomonas sp. MF6776]OTH08158.1 tellurite resistance protein [Pseudomonas aeruginosa]OTH22053.1 tellurite resistance protein [Pseudomonas aeruginosa]OTH33040.1 tellurite resistance protein [Pseudomonas aeruginosa]OTH48561.1 tellurite resistance protein [Pseudomonas aeruginosa]